MHAEKTEKGMVSIVVAVYNTEQYLYQCLESIRTQTYKLLEIILVDDGSTDNSYEICREYEELDSRFRVIQQKNSGPSSARNEGLKEISGEYLLFVDSDDILHQNACERLVSIILREDVGAVVFGLIAVNTITEETIFEIIPGNNRVYKLEKVINNVIRSDFKYGGGFTVNKFWRTEYLMENGKIDEFDEELFLYEDKDWNLRQLYKAKSIFLVNEILYTYRYNLIGLTAKNQQSEKMHYDIVYAYRKIMLNFKDINYKIYKIAEETYIKALCNSLITVLRIKDRTLKEEEWITKGILEVQKQYFGFVFNINLSFREKIKFLYLKTLFSRERKAL